MTKPEPRLLLALPIILISLLGVMYGYGLTYDPNKSPSRLIGKKIPVVNLPSLENTDIILNSTDFKKPALINVWASWCAACRAEHELLKQLSEEGVTIYGVDYQDDLENAKTYLKQQGNPFDAIMFDGAMASAMPLDIQSLPQTYLVDGNGIIRARYIGALTPNVWQKMQQNFN
ncbi:MAG: DsbE family thiol:disulfide interchange protein [Methylococcales bacterium]|nr:DsbE family thiol:disulfide interchange protein [Methylococcales bacterium]MDD5755312.1 DsbE family thiol:disulfide interchange protein [Methylococcales bacterium]